MIGLITGEQFRCQESRASVPSPNLLPVPGVPPPQTPPTCTRCPSSTDPCFRCPSATDTPHTHTHPWCPFKPHSGCVLRPAASVSCCLLLMLCGPMPCTVPHTESGLFPHPTLSLWTERKQGDPQPPCPGLHCPQCPFLGSSTACHVQEDVYMSCFCYDKAPEKSESQRVYRVYRF